MAINPLMTCNDCPACNSGNHHLCGTRELIGMRYPGAFAEQIMVPDANLTALTDHLSFSEAALAEPVAVAVRAVEIRRVPAQRRIRGSSSSAAPPSACLSRKASRGRASPRPMLSVAACWTISASPGYDLCE